MIRQLVTQSGSLCLERFPSLLVTFALSKANKTDHSSLTGLYFWIYHLDIVVLFHSVVWMYETRFCTVIWNVQEPSAAGTKLVLYVPFCVCILAYHSHKSGRETLSCGEQAVSGTQYINVHSLLSLFYDHRSWNERISPSPTHSYWLSQYIPNFLHFKTLFLIFTRGILHTVKPYTTYRWWFNLIRNI